LLIVRQLQEEGHLVILVVLMSAMEAAMAGILPEELIQAVAAQAVIPVTEVTELVMQEMDQTGLEVAEAEAEAVLTGFLVEAEAEA
jgi:hypothetical protein